MSPFFKFFGTFLFFSNLILFLRLYSVVGSKYFDDTQTPNLTCQAYSNIPLVLFGLILLGLVAGAVHLPQQSAARQFPQPS